MRLILSAALAAVLLGAVLAYWLNPPVKMPLLDTAGDQVLDADGRPKVSGLTYTQVENGVRKWTLSAKGARFDEEKELATLTDVKLVFYRKNGGWITLTGDEGEYDQKTKLVTLRGNVHGRTDDAMALDTDKLTYSEGSGIVDTDSIVTISGRRFKVRGRGMWVDIKREAIVFKEQVDSTFIPEGDGPPPGVTAEG